MSTKIRRKMNLGIALGAVLLVFIAIPHQGCLRILAKSNAFLWITFSLEHDSGVDILRSSPSEGSPCAHFNRRISEGMISRNRYLISCCDNGLRSMHATGARSVRLSDRDNGSAPRCSSVSSA